MFHLSQHGRFEAWVEVNGVCAEEFNIGISGRTSTSYITSRVGAELAVYVQEYQTMTSAYARADVYIEGRHIGSTILSPSKGSCYFAGSWVDDNTLRPLVFCLAKRKGCSSDAETVDIGSGKIVIEISEVVLFYEADEDDDLYIVPLPLREWPAPTIAEEDETMERHSIVLSGAVKQQKYKPQNGNFQSIPFDSSSPEPIAIFEFIYGSEDFVFRELRKLQEEPESDHNSIKTGAEATALRTPKTPDPKKRSRTDGESHDSDSSSPCFPHSSDESDPECTRCANSGVACESIGGKSAICWRCRKLKKGCDLPHMIKLYAKERENMRRFRERKGDGAKRVGLRRHGAKRACRWNYCHTLSSDMESSRSGSSERQSGTQSKQAIHEVYEVEDSSDAPSIENTNNAEPRRRASQATESADRGDVQDTDSEYFSCDTSVPLTCMDEDRRKTSLSNSDTVKPSHSDTSHHYILEILKSVRSPSDQVKEIVPADQAGRGGPALGAEVRLMRMPGSSGRRIEAQSHIMDSLKIYGSDSDDDRNS